MSLCPSCPSGCDVSVTATITVTDSAAKTSTVTSSVVTTSGTVAAGKSSMSFFNFGAAAVTVNGQSLAAGAAISFPFLGDNKTYGAIAYDATGSSLRIDTTVIP